MSIKINYFYVTWSSGRGSMGSFVMRNKGPLNLNFALEHARESDREAMITAFFPIEKKTYETYLADKDNKK